MTTVPSLIPLRAKMTQKTLVEILSKMTEPVLVFCRSYIYATAAMLDTRQSISDARQVTVHLLRNKNSNCCGIHSGVNENRFRSLARHKNEVFKPED
jgi:hypothetical protein